MSETPVCANCGQRGPEDLDTVPLGKGYVFLLKDWKTWAFAVGVTVAIGMITGALNMGTSAVGAGGGAAIAAFMMARLAKVRQCKKCSSLLMI